LVKVVFVNRYFHPDESATSRMVSSLAFALAERGHDVSALCSRGRRDGAEGTLPEAERVRGVEIVRLGGSRPDRGGLAGRAADYLAFHLSAAAWLARHLARGDVCVICTDPPLQTVSARLPIAIRGARMVHWVMDLYPETAIELGLLPRTGLATRLALVLRDWSLGAASRVICLTEAMRDHLARRGISADRLVIFRHWSDATEIAPVDVEANPLRAAWGLQGQFVVGYSGNFGRAHEFSTLLDAAELLRNERDVTFLMIGDGARRGWVEEETRRRGLKSFVFKPLQPVEQISASLGVPDVHLVSLLPQLEHCIVPSKFFGILAAGRPTLFVGAVDGWVAQVARSTRCGEASASGDGAGLAARIRDLRANPLRRAEMGARARQLLVSAYGRSQAVDAWDALLRDLGYEVPASGATMAAGEA
jgi:glycosyltransferase involved in cell wall biosynthesis